MEETIEEILAREHKPARYFINVVRCTAIEDGNVTTYFDGQTSTESFDPEDVLYGLESNSGEGPFLKTINSVANAILDAIVAYEYVDDRKGIVKSEIEIHLISNYRMLASGAKILIASHPGEINEYENLSNSELSGIAKEVNSLLEEYRS